MTILARPSEWKRSSVEQAGTLAPEHHAHPYFAFLSYSHRDEATAKWLHEALERFRTPGSLVGTLTEHGVVPRRLTPIFRDVGELPAADDLGAEIRSALSASRFLIVLCSPAAAQSKWTNAEIELFKRVRPEGCVLAAIIAGEPFASDMPGREDEECLPRALRFKHDRRGRPIAKRAEPLAADLRGDAEARRLGLLKLIAGMLGVGLDDLVQRHTLRRQRHMAIVTAASLAGTVVASGLALLAIDARNAASEQRREAESLVGFMLGDLRAKLDPLGRLDVLDSVGARALEYYEKQDTAALSDESLAQRSKALTLMGEIANTRGDLPTALRLYREAHAGTAEAMRRDPDNPQRLFDHAQNVFWIGYIDWQRGQLDRAAASFLAYRSLAERMMALQPLEPKWRLEGKYADTNLGILLMDQRRYAQAADAFQRSLTTVEALAAGDSDNRDYQNARLEALAWLADARNGEGRLEDALAQRSRQIDLLQKHMAASPDDTEFTRKSMTAHMALSDMLADRGELRAALAHGRRAGAYADTLMATEPNNTEWLEYAALARINLAALLRLSGDRERALAAVQSGCAMTEQLIARDRSVRSWNEDLRLSCLSERSRVALAVGAPDDALRFARQAIGVAESSRGRTPVDAVIHRAAAYQLTGNAHWRLRQLPQARQAWRRAAQTWPNGVGLHPDHLAQQALALRAVGEAGRAEALTDRLDAMGYRNPEFVELRTTTVM